MNQTTRRFARSMGEAFKDASYASAVEAAHLSIFTRLRIWLRGFFN